MVKHILCILFLILWGSPVFGQSRSFTSLFPNLDEEDKRTAFSAEGLAESNNASAGLQLLPAGSLGRNISQAVLDREPAIFVESILVIPYTNINTGRTFDLVTVYNALGKVRNLKGRIYHSASRDENVPLFEDAVRIASPQKTTVIPDAPDAAAIPASETVYIRLKDVNFGNSYYQAQITRTPEGLLYTLSNFRNLSYGFIPIIKEDKFIAQLYIEPLAEGLLVYSLAGADVSDFIASRISISSAIRKRLQVIVGWLIEGIS
jgi:hypothetical protein